MVNLEQLKQEIEQQQQIALPLIFIFNSTSFVARQYVHAISENNHMDIQFVDSLEEIPPHNEQHDTIYVCSIESIKAELYVPDDTIILTEKILKEARKMLDPVIVEFPALEQWQIIDYINVKCPGLDPNMTQWLVTAYNSNIDRIQTELDKLIAIPEKERSIIFEQMYQEGAFNTFSDQYHMRITQAVQNKDLEEVATILADPDRDCLEPLTISAFIQNNFKKLMKVWLSSNPTQETTGLSSKQIYAINKLPRKYTREQLVAGFQLVSGVERRVKEGELPINIVIDYLIIKLLGDCA